MPICNLRLDEEGGVRNMLKMLVTWAISGLYSLS